jgi:hypothetical protein
MQRTLDQLGSDERTMHLALTLAFAERPATERVVWVIDQFEEVFTLCRNEQERAQFIANLLYAASVPDGRCIVILTLRADFYPKCATYPELSSLIGAQQFLVSLMSIDGLRQAIEDPARRIGLELEQGLVETILDDVENQPGALPLLEHALLELWGRRRGRMMTLEGYHDSGCVAGAIAKRADSIYDAFPPDQQAITRRIMLRLTQFGEGTEDTRRRATMSELRMPTGNNDATEAVVRALADVRLLTTNADENNERWVDVSHEALIRSWPRLQHWIDEDRAGLRIHRRLAEAAQEWQRLNRDEEILYRGGRLIEALAWSEQKEAELNNLEQAFLDQSAKLQAFQKQNAKNLLIESQRSNELNLAFDAVMVIFGLGAVIIIFPSFIQAWEEQGQAYGDFALQFYYPLLPLVGEILVGFSIIVCTLAIVIQFLMVFSMRRRRRKNRLWLLNATPTDLEMNRLKESESAEANKSLVYLIFGSLGMTIPIKVKLMATWLDSHFICGSQRSFNGWLYLS